MCEVVYSCNSKRPTKWANFLVDHESIDDYSYRNAFYQSYKKDPHNYSVREFGFGFLVKILKVNVEGLELPKLLLEGGQNDYLIKEVFEECQKLKFTGTMSYNE